jgi:hypothetical protein
MVGANQVVGRQIIFADSSILSNNTFCRPEHNDVRVFQWDLGL